MGKSLDRRGSETRFQRFKRRSGRMLEMAKGGFRAHLYAWAGVNGFLVFLWAMTGAGHPWFLYPLGGWGIGLIQHYVTLRGVRERHAALAELDGLSDAGLRLFRRRFRILGGYRHHSAFTGSVTAYLGMIWALNGGGYPWWLIPGAALSISLALYRISMFPRLRALDAALAEAIDGEEGGEPASFVPVRPPQESRESREAAALGRRIARELDKLPASLSEYAGEVAGLTDRISGSIEALDMRRGELEEILRQTPKRRLEVEERRLQERAAKAESDLLRSEYRQTLELIEAQKSGLAQLEEQRELAEAKIGGALNTLRHLHIDLSRTAVEGSGARREVGVDELRRQSEELTAYLADFRKELEGMQ